jgi:hypothetical protein
MISDEQIRKIRRTCQDASDSNGVEACDRALLGDQRARQFLECVVEIVRMFREKEGVDGSQ